MDIDRLIAVSRLTDALSRAATLDAVYSAALDALEQSLGVSRASILLFDEKSFCAFVAWRGLSDAYRAKVNGHTPWRPDSSNPEPIVVDDVEAGEAWADYRETFAAESIRALGFFPLNYRDRVLGKFMLYYDAPHHFAPDEIDLAKTIAAQIAFGVARVRVELELERERARLVDLVANVPGMVWETVGVPGNQAPTFVSEGIRQLVGYTPDDWYSNPDLWKELVVDLDAQRVGDAMVSAARDGQPQTQIHRLRRKDGRLIWTEVRSAHRFVGDQIISRGVTLDITEQKEAERRGEFLSEASALLTSSLNYEKTFETLAQLAVADLADWCVVDLFNERDEIERVTVAHRDPAKHDLAMRMRDEFPPAQHEIGLARHVVESGQPALLREIDDTLRERLKTMPMYSVLESLGFTSLMIVPLTAGGRKFGALSFVSSGERRFDESDLAVAAELARRAAYAIDNARLYRKAEQERRHSACLSNASSLLASSLDYDTTLARVAQLLVEQLADWCAIDVVEADDEEPRRVAVVHRDPAKSEAATKLKEVPAKSRTHHLQEVIASGKARLFSKIAAPEELTNNSALQTLLRELGIASSMLVPLVAGGRTFGALSFVSSDPARLYDERDLAFATELASRAAYAIDNARLYRHAQDANRAKDEFLATLSHELRTPMTATLGWATMLRVSDISPENFQLAVETIERSTKAQAKLIDEILDVSRIVTGKLQLNIAPVHLGNVIEAAVDAIRPSIAAKGLRLDLKLARIDAMPLGDAVRLQQVIWNLLSNSVKFTPPNGTITIALDQPTSDSVRISVLDTGMGISRKLLPHVFERFRQADSSSTRAHGGLGLGLAIVKNIVELHGGVVQARSDGDDKGAVFTITLPVVFATSTANAPPPLRTDTVTLDGVSVLLLEDEDDTRRMMTSALRAFGAEVTAVSTVPAAIDALRAQSPHVIVSDIGLPGEDGYNFMLQVRAGAVEMARNLPAIAVTAYARAEDRERILASGFSFHLAKPVDPVVMARTVREAARK